MLFLENHFKDSYLSNNVLNSFGIGAVNLTFLPVNG